jgi:CBS domain-containing protein
MTAIPPAGATPVSQLIGDEVVRLDSDATLRDVARALTADAVGAVVLGHDGRPQALVSERDLVRSMAAGDDPATTAASTVASRELVWCDVDSTVDEVAAEMLGRYIRWSASCLVATCSVPTTPRPAATAAEPRRLRR